MTYNRCMAKRDDDLEFSVNAAFDEARAVVDKVPLYLVNGSLGAGKTSVLEFLLQQSDYKGARVIEITEANHNQKCAAKGINHRRGFVQNMPVFRRSIQRQINHFHKSMAARHHHDDNRQHEPHHKHRHENPNRQEYFLPNLAHAGQYLAVNHRVVKAKGNLQHYQNRKQPQAARAEMSENQPAQRQCQQRRKPKNPKWVMRMPEMFHIDLV